MISPDIKSEQPIIAEPRAIQVIHRPLITKLRNTTAAIGLTLLAACGSSTPEQPTAVATPSIPTASPETIPTTIPSITPTTEVPATVLTPAAQNTPETAKPIAKEDIPSKLDELVDSVQALNEPIFTKISQTEFAGQKENIKIQAQQVEDALKSGDIAKAKERAVALKGSIINLGDPLKSISLTPEEKQKLDPTNQALDPFDAVDPAIMENGIFPSIIRIQIALNSLSK